MGERAAVAPGGERAAAEPAPPLEPLLCELAALPPLPARATGEPPPPPPPPPPAAAAARAYLRDPRRVGYGLGCAVRRATARDGRERGPRRDGKARAPMQRRHGRSIRTGGVRAANRAGRGARR